MRGTTGTDFTGGSGLPLSHGQERLWFLDQLDPGDASYNIPLVLRLSGPLSVEALRAAFDGIVARHEALRTRFPDVDGRPVAVVEPANTVPVEVLDLRADGVAGRADAILAARTNGAFDLAGGPLLRAALLRTADEEHLLCVVLHHIVADGWSLNLLRAELETRYAAHLDGRAVELPGLLPYTVHAARERESAQGPDAQRALDYWRERLTGVPVLDLHSGGGTAGPDGPGGQGPSTPGGWRERRTGWRRSPRSAAARRSWCCWPPTSACCTGGPGRTTSAWAYRRPAGANPNWRS